MRFNERAATSLASVLASSRVALLLVGVLVLSESVLLATTLFSGAGLSFVATLLIAMKAYRVRTPRPADAQRGPATADAAVLAAIGSRARAAKSRAVAA
jgi:hypothetical protein